MKRLNPYLLIAVIGFMISQCCLATSLQSEYGPCSLEFRAGVDPILFSDGRETFEIVSNINDQEGRLDTLYDGFKFSDIFKTPWIVAGQLNWNINNCHIMFLECNYARAVGQTITRTGSLRSSEGEIAIEDEVTFGDFSMIGAYFGHRYFWNLFTCTDFYFGSKIGLGHYQEICIDVKGINESEGFNASGIAYSPETVVSGGLQIGFDCSVTECFGFMLQAEVLGSGALDNTVNAIIIGNPDEPISGSNIILGKTGTLVSFPITFGLRWNW